MHADAAKNRGGMRRIGRLARPIATLCLAAILVGALSANAEPEFVKQRPIASGSIVAVYSIQDNPFNALLGRKQVRASRENEVQRVQRYVLAGGERVFLFQVVDSRALIQFQCAKNDPRIDCQIDPELMVPEILTLLPIRAPRGDIIYKDMQGESVLRIASYGGASVWWPGTTEAQAASRSYSDRSMLSMPMANQQIVVQRANRATALLSAMIGAPITFETGATFPERSIGLVDSEGLREREQNADSAKKSVPANRAASLASADEVAAELTATPPNDRALDLLADSVTVVATGIANVASDETGARVLSNRLSRVEFYEASAPDIQLEGSVLRIGIHPASGLQGRPSSAQITRFLEENL